MRYLILLITLHSYFSNAQTWEMSASLPSIGRDDGVGFSQNGKGYVVTGNQGGFSESNRLWCYDPFVNSWTEKATFPGVPRQYSVAITLQDETLLIGGVSENGSALNDVWSYSSEFDSWRQLHNFPGLARWSAIGFSFGNKLYFGTGTTSDSVLSDMWRYEMDFDKWIKITDFPGGGRREMLALPVNDVCFVGMGFSINPLSFSSSFYRFSCLDEKWIASADYPGVAQSYATGIGVGSFAYTVGGYNQNALITNEVYRINRAGEWQQQPNIPFIGIRGMSAFAVNGTAYFGTGLTDQFVRVSDFYRFNSANTIPSEILVYPNPSKTESVLIAPSKTEAKLFNLFGQLVFKGVVGDNQLLIIPKQNIGLYVLQLNNNGFEDVRKIAFD